ncbi:MAG: hypothetical protein KJS95_13310 [Gammaproteobacteria bacterium]|nr:hypothetical protein [Gammaproteobacteria bacterium]
MDKIIRPLLILAVCSVLAVVAWYLMLPWATVRCRLIIEAEAAGRPLTGSGVIEVRYQKQPTWLSGRYSSSRAHGQSVWIDVPGEGPIFALTMSEKRFSAYDFLPRAAFAVSDLDSLGKFLQLSRLSGRRELPLENWPMFVRFQNLRDPTSVEGIDPDELAVGASPVTAARVTKIWVEITRDPITTGIDEKLPAMTVMRATRRIAGDPRLWPAPGRRRIEISPDYLSREDKL